MILSVSRRTDVPSYYSDWFYNRIKDGFVYTKNPMNDKQVSKIAITPDVVDCIVFWTKNPKPMIDRLDELENYNYYFQFTLNSYDTDIESALPDKRKVLIPVFQELSDKIGADKVIWRYDPIMFNNKYTPEYHIEAFTEFAKALNGYTNHLVISFLDFYAKIQKNMQSVGNYEISDSELIEFAKTISEIAHTNGMTVGTCAEKIDLQECNIMHNSCIDKNLIEKIIGYELNGKKDKGQRAECGCMESIDIGTYNTCKHGCKYCYANYSSDSVCVNAKKYNPNSPILCDVITDDCKITERKVKSLRKW